MTTSKTIVLSAKDQTELRRLVETAHILCGYLELLSNQISKDEECNPDIEAHLINCLDLSKKLMEYTSTANILGNYHEA